MTNVLITTAKVLTLDLDSTKAKQQDDILSPCGLKWRQGKLWVDRVKTQSLDLPALRRKQWLTDCLRKSSIRQVCLDLNLGEQSTKIWADACKKAKKEVFIRIPSSRYLPTKQNKICWRIKRILDWSAAAVILTVLSPIMLAIALAIKIVSPGPTCYCQWRVGKRGKLFQVYKFRTMIVDAEKMHDRVMSNCDGLHKREDDPRITPIGKWLRKYSLDELPQLFNVLKGEMSLVGPRPWALYDALRLGKDGKQRLNALPGITGAWQVKGRSYLLDLEQVTKCDLEYLHSWSLIKDLKILLMTIPKVVSGFGAY
jgi:lipopolysaccharide/colanic/teichoic acid biosynthesis glycosyltransferase